MSRTLSRLHTLERCLKKPRKSRAKPRTVTTLRLEGVTGRALAKHTPARLPTDLEEQIAVVRGRAIAKPSRGLLQLEKRLLRTSEVELAKSAIQRYDHGSPPPTVTPPPASTPRAPVGQAHALSAVAPGASGGFSGRFNVESFEEQWAAPPVLTPRADATINTQPVKSPAAPSVPWEGPSGAGPAGGTAGSFEQSARRANKSALTHEQQDVAANFERDLAVMLGSSAPAAAALEDKQWENTMRSVAGGQPAQVAPGPAVAPEAPPAPKQNAHEVFTKMGLAMTYANSFDLGAVDSSARFDQFDDELALASKAARAARSPSTVPVQTLALDEFDLVADLTEISGAQSTAALSGAPPASETAVEVKPDPAANVSV